MRSYVKHVLGSLIVLALLAANLGVASAHQWSNYHWNRGGSWVTIRIFNFASNWSQANSARYDWSINTILYNPSVGYHTDVSVFDGNYGNTGWGGLASLEDRSWDWGSWSFAHIEHGHARLNTYYGWTSADKQGVFCQEIGHTFGLDHSNTGDCMGKGYFNNSNVTSPHNANDIYNMYRWH